MKFVAHRALLTLTVLILPVVASAQSREEARLLTATQAVEATAAMPDQSIPGWLLARAYGIAVFPEVVKLGMFVGGQRGKGVLVIRDAQGGWTNPSFVTLTGGSFGLQMGAQSADIILVFTTKESVEGIEDGKVTLGADASAAAGPVGRQTSAATDFNLSAEVYSYSRAKGLFAGLAIDGSALTIDRKANAAFYGKSDVTTQEIFAGTVTTTVPAVQRFISSLDQSTRTAAQEPGAASNTQGAPAATGTPPASPAAPATAEPAKTFPMEDQNPGQEPPG